jgi:hypothetical protein
LLQLQFAFPGGGAGEERSGGGYDLRGPKSVRALADVIRFATGRLADSKGRYIGELTGGIRVLTNNVGLIGASHGGNVCIQAMGRHGAEFANLAWYASMESPLGEGAVNIELGGHETGLNPAYDSSTGKLDLSRLAWSETLVPGFTARPLPAATRELSGALFFDVDGDGGFFEQHDFPASCVVGNAGNGVRAWYSPRLVAELEKRELAGASKPAHLPTLAEAREFWAWRDGAPMVANAVSNCAGVAVIVYANERDHVQADPRHTHILVQLEGFQKARGRFVRLNPDRAYVRWAAPGRPWQGLDSEPVDNPAHTGWSAENLHLGLEPVEVRMGICMQAAVCELADRTQAGKWTSDLDAVLYPQAPRFSVPPPLGPTRLGLRLDAPPPRTNTLNSAQ